MSLKWGSGEERGSYKKILIATDGSESSTHAINAGMEIARLSEGNRCR
ncbi:universal stress protein [Methanosarcina sp. MSH10X1]|nr:universal stress protein [Methanosarcina sp. MSH10X1]